MQADPRIPASPPDDLLSGRRGFFTPGGFAWMWQYTAPPMRMGPILCVHDLDLTSVPPGMPERKYYRVPGFPYTQRSLEEQLRLIRRAPELLHQEEALISVAIAEHRIFAVTLDVNWLRAIADVVHEDDPELAKTLRRLHTKTRKQATVEWLKGKFGL